MMKATLSGAPSSGEAMLRAAPTDIEGPLPKSPKPIPTEPVKRYNELPGSEIEFPGPTRVVPAPNVKNMIDIEADMPHPIKPKDVTKMIDAFLEPGPTFDINPLTGKVEKDRIYSFSPAGGLKSVRFGRHEVTSPKGHHFHFEYWQFPNDPKDPFGVILNLKYNINKQLWPIPKPGSQP